MNFVLLSLLFVAAVRANLSEDILDALEETEVQKKIWGHIDTSSSFGGWYCNNLCHNRKVYCGRKHYTEERKKACKERYDGHLAIGNCPVCASSEEAVADFDVSNLCPKMGSWRDCEGSPTGTGNNAWYRAWCCNSEEESVSGEQCTNPMRTCSDEKPCCAFNNEEYECVEAPRGGLRCMAVQKAAVVVDAGASKYCVNGAAKGKCDKTFFAKRCASVCGQAEEMLAFIAEEQVSGRRRSGRRGRRRASEEEVSRFSRRRGRRRASEEELSCSHSRRRCRSSEEFVAYRRRF